MPALAAVVASLALPVLAAGGGVSATASNVTAHAAQSDEDGERLGGEQFPVGSPRFQTARRVADEYWGGTACGGNVAISWAPLDRGTNATASWRNPTHAWDNPGENFDCVIVLNGNANYDLPKLCTVLAHEFGHLKGRQHADRSGDLMSPMYSKALPDCEAAAPAEQVAPAIPVASKKRTLRSQTRCVRVMKGGRRVTRCARVARRSSAGAKRVRR